jgi:signal transduction histidine kinase
LTNWYSRRQIFKKLEKKLSKTINFQPDNSDLMPVRRAPRIAVISADTKLLTACREAVEALRLDSSEIVLRGPDQNNTSPTDLVIVDTEYSNPLLGEPVRCSRQLFVVDRRQLREFASEMPVGITLVKPVTPRILEIFIEEALARDCQKSFVGESPNGPDALQCLLMANAKLQEYDQDRTNFLARALHDVRAPLMALSGYSSILMQQNLGPLTAEQVDLVSRMQRCMRKLTRMTTGMLQLSASKHVGRSMDLRESSSLQSCINSATYEVETIAHDKKISISFQLADANMPLYFDSNQIEQVMVNLLENACKFTPRGGHIEVRGYPVPVEGAVGDYEVSKHPNRSESLSRRGYRVDVRDSGPGIAKDHLESIFEEYTTYAGLQDRSGAGLGLAICKMIVKAHEGQIWAENHSAGAQLSFFLPESRPHISVMTNKQPRTVGTKAC